MTADPANWLSRLVPVTDVPPEGLDITVEATPEERAEIAGAFGLLGIESLTGRYHLAGDAHRLVVTGDVAARVRQTCVVSLEPFDADVIEQVEVVFSEDAGSESIEEDEDAAEPPDELIDGRIDLGTLTTEFLALGLDPHPRKPGAEFAFEQRDETVSPFAGLSRLKDRDAGS